MNLLGETNVLFSRLDSLTRQIMEEQQPTHAHRQSLRTLRLLKRRLDELQTGILDVRMVPLEQLFDKLSRIVRKMSREAGKPVEFFVSGAETELDKLIVEELSDPLMHIIRNCIDHGIEPPEVRKEAGKRPEGLVALRAFQKGNHVIIEVEDDGAGISPETVLSTALQKKLIGREAAADLSEREILNLIFLPGFTTRAHADETSGRGVGMDVVKTNLAKLSGLVDIQSTLGMGTKFILTLPITLAILRALVVRCADQLYAVPLNSVLEALSVSAGQIRTVENREVITLRGATLPLLRLSALFGLGSAPRQDEHHFVIVVGMAQHRVGLVVDELQGQQDIVIKSLGKALASVPGIAGATELGTERIVLVLDLAALVDEALSRLSRTRTVA
jgi:two-component system chemotaxis sensor kinase CheA